MFDLLAQFQLQPWYIVWAPWIVAAVIVVLGLLVFGFRDMLRFSPRRVWAISSVNFAESIRRRVWVIVLLAIPAVIVVSQLQHPVDEQDAIRQTTKFCLFASGMVVVVTAIILACTNLPREIESRVIYTVVTKPATRLEIIVGKVVGFARVSAAILLVMGVFTFLYLELRQTVLRKYVVQRLESKQEDPISRATLEHYKQTGLLSARQYDMPDDLQIYSRLPAADDERRYMYGGEGSFIVPFSIPDEMLVDPQDPSAPADLAVALYVGFEKSKYQPDSEEGPTTLPYLIQNPDATPEQVQVVKQRGPEQPPGVTVEILDQNLNTLVEPGLINKGRPVALRDPTAEEAAFAPLDSQGVAQLSRAHGRVVFVQITGSSAQWEFFAKQLPVVLVTADNRGIKPLRDPRSASISGGRENVLPSFRGRSGAFGMQLRGGKKEAPLALFRFRDAPLARDVNGNIQFEMRVGIERSGNETGEDAPSEVDFSIVDRAKGAAATTSQPIKVYPETNRTSYVAVPASMIPSRDFDVVLNARTPGQFIGVTPRSVSLIAADESFAFNLFKSLLILWMLSVLVVIVSVFCSTFLSWPIAIVLTLLILLGHWGVQQLGDATAPGIGNMVVQDLFRTADPNVATTVSKSVEALTRLLNIVTSVLPDITQFSALEDMERGIALPMKRLGDSLQVLVLFGIPISVLSYVVLRNKEVAP